MMRLLTVVTIVNIFLVYSGPIAVRSQYKRQGNRSNRRCRYRGIYYQENQRLSFDIGEKSFDCTCVKGGRLDCTWIYITTPQNAKCSDSVSGELKHIGQTWERIINGKIFDCVCQRGNVGMQITCSDENRCHHQGVSYTKGMVFKTDQISSAISGRSMTCTCLGKKKLECRYEEVLVGPETDAQWVEDYIVYGGKSIRPQITTLQACRTGAKVVTSGVVWNQTVTNPLGARVVESCTCLNAIVRCNPVQVLDRVEPRCTSADGRHWSIGKKWLKVREHAPSLQYECICLGHNDISCRRVRRTRCVHNIDGTIHIAGEKWVRVHESFPNLKFECTCHGNREVTCKDVGKCNEPSAPANGALLCARVGKSGPGQVIYCKPMCLADYDFVNTLRYYRPWEVCGSMNLHRWSGGYVADPSAIARCTAQISSRRKGHENLYLPTNYCTSLSKLQIEQLKTRFLQQLRYRNLCGNGCEVTVFKCGTKE